MNRREFTTPVGGAAAAWPLAARAQQPTMPVVGFLHAGTPSAFASLVIAFREGLDTAGYVEGRSVTIEYRWAENHYERLPALLTDLVGRRVAVIAALGDGPAATAKAGTRYSGRCDGRQRSGGGGPRREPQPTRRQHHRDQHVHERSDG